MKISVLTIILVPLSLLIGVAASMIGFTAWLIIVPILFVICGFNLYLTIFSSLLVDCGNAFVMTLIALKNHQIDPVRGALLSIFALIWIVAGIALGTTFIPDHENLFRGSSGFVAILIGVVFVIKGLKQKKETLDHGNSDESLSGTDRPGMKNRRIRQILVYPGVALMAFQVGLFGIGGGMGYVLFLMLCLSFPILKATGTAMMMTFFSTLAAACGIYFQIPDGLIVPKTYSLVLMIAGLSMLGTYIGAKVTYSLTEQKVRLLIGAIVILAGLIATAQKYVIQHLL
ncbi:MAG: sulfite exporter TauE/SafE family protein [Pseudomonadota bacterium]